VFGFLGYTGYLKSLADYLTINCFSLVKEKILTLIKKSLLNLRAKINSMSYCRFAADDFVRESPADAAFHSLSLSPSLMQPLLCARLDNWIFTAS
jgi:hypothetical protein